MAESDMLVLQNLRKTFNPGPIVEKTALTGAVQEIKGDFFVEEKEETKNYSFGRFGADRNEYHRLRI